jgi:hypothetical protein
MNEGDSVVAMDLQQASIKAYILFKILSNIAMI